MITKKIRYKDIDGNPAEAEYCFRIGEADLGEMELRHKGELVEHFKNIIATQDGNELVERFKSIMYTAVGRRVGNRIVKNDDVREEFFGTGAYDALFMELILSKDGGADFFIGMLPEDLQKQAVENAEKQYSEEELLAMSDDEFARVAGRDPQKMTQQMLLVGYKRRSAA